MFPHQAKLLDLHLLDSIINFEKYKCAVWNLHSIFIKFHVKYKDGSEGDIFAGSYIQGQTSSSFHLLQLQTKAWEAKRLLGDDEWKRLEQNYGIKRDKTLVLSRSNNLNNVLI